MKNSISLLLICCISLSCKSSNIDEFAVVPKYTYPGTAWKYADPASKGFDVSRLDDVTSYIEENTQGTGVVIVASGEVIYTYGDIEATSVIASCRKSVLSILYGKYVENGVIDLKKTVGDLDFDDVGGLLPIEKQANLHNLITARSGVYHPASNPGDYQPGEAPARGSQQPGTYYLYNNWDFNVAGAAFEKLTGKTVYKAVEEDIAGPVGMQDYYLDRQKRGGDKTISQYLAYHLYLSTRDMARIGYLALRQGEWNGKQIFPKAWMQDMVKITTPVAEMNPDYRKKDQFGYGYMWWIFDPNVAGKIYEGAFTARGSGGQYITVIPKLDLVVAFKTLSTTANPRSTKFTQYAELLNLVIKAYKGFEN